MEKKDLPAIWAYASALWGTFKAPDTKEKFNMAMEVWAELLGEYDLRVIKAAMIELSKESDFCTVGKLVKHCQTISKLEKGEIVDVDEVIQAIIKAEQSMDKKKAFEELPAIAKDVVGHPSMLYKWAMMDSNSFHSVVVSNLRKSIEKRLDISDTKEAMQKAQITIAEKPKVQLVLFDELQGGENVEDIEI